MEGDEDLLAASLVDPSRFEELVRIYQHRIYVFLARRDAAAADDLLGDVWLAAFAGRARFDPQLGTVRGWLYGIAHNVLLVHFRRVARDARRLPVSGQERWDEWQEVDARLDAARLTGELKRALAELAPGDLQVLLLVTWDDLSLKEVGQVLGIPAGTARSRLHRVRRQLSMTLREHAAPSRQLLGEGARVLGEGASGDRGEGGFDGRAR